MPATGSVVLDTTIVVSVLRRAPGMQERLKSATQLYLPLFALGELENGHFIRVVGLDVLDWS